MTGTNGNTGKKAEELLYRWHNLSTLRGLVGQPGALPASKLDAEEAALRRETERLAGVPGVEAAFPGIDGLGMEARAA